MKDRNRLSSDFSTNQKRGKKTKAILQRQDYLGKAILYMAMEWSNANWKLGFSNGSKERVVTVKAGESWELLRQVSLAREKLHLPEDCPVACCYEAGRDGFWIHRMLEENGIENLMFDPSGIAVS